MPIRLSLRDSWARCFWTWRETRKVHTDGSVVIVVVVVVIVVVVVVVDVGGGVVLLSSNPIVKLVEVFARY